MKNPKECFTLRQNQTFFVLNELTKSTCEDGSEPLKFHHDTFSRFKFVIINADKKATTANIPVVNMPGIFESVKMKHFMMFMNAPITDTNNKEESKSPAYTVAIISGTLRGKTPAGALLENAEVNKTLLENQVKWLTSNLNKYPKNQIQIDAIKEALDLFEQGKLLKDESTPAASVNVSNNVIYETGMRPLIRRKRPDGKCFVYEISITWNSAMKKPIQIEMKNYFAPVVQKENGLLNVVAKEKADEIRNVFSLSLDDWFWMEHVLETQMRTFEDLNAPKMYKTALEAESYNKSQAFK